MAYKEFQLDELGAVKIYKRRGNKSLRLSVTGAGEVRVTIPSWASYAAGVAFARSRKSWIATHKPTAPALLTEGMQIGKAHRLHFEPVTTGKVTTRIRQTEVVVSYPAATTPHNAIVQRAAKQASIRALRAQAEKLLPQRLATLAAAHDLQYRSVSVRQLKSRWGSCDQHQNIVLNVYLMQLPWDLIDYVLLHELAHTQVMQHGPKFWAAMDTLTPHTAALRKGIRAYRPLLAS